MPRLWHVFNPVLNARSLKLHKAKQHENKIKKKAKTKCIKCNINYIHKHYCSAKNPITYLFQGCSKNIKTVQAKNTHSIYCSFNPNRNKKKWMTSYGENGKRKDWLLILKFDPHL